MKIENISFTFENCEYITVDGKNVGQFLAEDIKTYFQRIACNAINKIETIHTLVIELHKDANKPYKLRLMYEANPMSFLIEQAGGISSTGYQRIMDIQPPDIHQRVAVILGSKHEVETCLKYHQE